MENKPVEHWKNLNLEPISESINGILYVEEWRLATVIGYEVSSFGRIKSIEKSFYSGRNNMLKQTYPTKILRIQQDKDRYLYTTLKSKKNKIHRLVGFAFVENPENKPHINHIDGNRTNNHFTNICWCTIAENNQHAYDVLGKKLKLYSTPVIQLSNSFEFIKEWISMNEASREMEVAHGNIWVVCKNPLERTCKGFRWMYKADYDSRQVNTRL